MAASISSEDGKKCSIIGLAKAAAGTSGEPRRITGPSSHYGRYLPRDRAGKVGLGDHHYLACLFGRIEDRLFIQRIQRPRLYDLGLYAVLCGELLGHLEGCVEHEAVGDDRDIRALAVDAGLSEGHLVIFGDLLLYEAVGTFVFEEEDGVGVADGAL